MGTKCIWSVPSFGTGGHFWLGTENHTVLPQTSLLNLRGEESSREGSGQSNNGKGGRDGGRKGRGSASTPCEVPSNFSALDGPMCPRQRALDND